MARTATRKAKPKVLTLPASCGIRGVAELHQSLEELLDVDGKVVIDAGAVESVDVSVLQVLLAFLRDRRQWNGDVDWQRVSDEFRAASTLSGFAQALGLPDGAQQSQGAAP